MAAGNLHNLALKNDGTVVSWGFQTAGTPPAALTNVIAIAAGQNYSLALLSNHTLVGWGTNTSGVLNLPAQQTNIVGIAAGTDSAAAVTLQPVIITQPVGFTLTASKSNSLSVKAFGSTPLSYQWRKNGTNLLNASNSSISFTNLQAADTGSYSVLLSNSGGTLLSASASVTVNPVPPTIVANITNRSVVAGANVTFQVAATGSEPFSYQWLFKGVPITDATNSALTLINVTSANQGAFQAKVINAYGTATSAQATLTVNYPPSVTTPPTTWTLTAGTNWIFQMAASGNQPLFYQWQFQGTNIAGATNVSLVLSNIQTGDVGQYSIVVSNAFGMVTNLVDTLSVSDSPPVIYQQPVSQSFAPDYPVALRVLAYGSAPMSVQWWHNGDPVDGATNLTLSFYYPVAGDAGSYYVTLSNALGFATSSAAVLSVGDPYPGQIDWPSFGFTPVVTNSIPAPTCITHAGDGTGRIFVVEQGGLIQIIQASNLLSQPFLDVTDRLAVAIEKGLLGLAFPPGFATNKHFYVDYTRKLDSATVISRFTLSSTNANVADTNTEEVLLVIPQPFDNHKGGQIAFGPDGYLYIGMGDGGSGFSADPYNNAQNPASLLGKLLRIDVESGVSPYAVPASNPFVANTNYAPEIWALGLRNPWRFSFDRGSGDFFIGDVGESSWEEIDYEPAGSSGGKNYGWRLMEGPRPYLYIGNVDPASLTPPITSYPRSVGACVIGGYVFRGFGQPRMYGKYFHGDFISGRISALQQAGTGWLAAEIIRTPYAISTFGEDDDANLYVADYTGGKIYKISDNFAVTAPTISPSGGSFTNDRSVVLTSPTLGTLIHYTTDGRDPTEYDLAVPSGSGIQVAATMTLKARAYRDGFTPSGVTAATFTFKVATPVFSVASGAITNGTPLTITTLTSNAVIHYTLDGTSPNSQSLLYTSPLTLPGDARVIAQAYRDGYTDSDGVQATYSLAVVPTPVISPTSGMITNGTLVKLTCGFPDAQLRYSTNGSNPDLTSPLYTNPFPISGNSTLVVKAWLSNYAPSALATATYSLLDYEPTVVQTYAGTGVPGFTNGPNLKAQFNAPQGICVDGLGTLFVSDTGNNVIRKISTNGVVTTFAGSGVAGTHDGVGTNASFLAPTGIALDSSNNLYVADSGNSLIRKVTPDGLVTTLTTFSDPSQQGPALWQLALATNGTMYVSASFNIFQVNSDGTFTNFAGPGVCCPPSWSDQMGLTLGLDGTLFGSMNTTASAVLGRVLRFSSTGGYELYAGDLSGYMDGPRLLARFQRPKALATASDGSIIVSDWTRIRKIHSDGRVTTLAGAGDLGLRNGSGLFAAFNQLGAVTVDSAGNIYAADAANHSIRKISVDMDRDGIPDVLEGGTTPYVVGIDDSIVDSDHDGMSNTSEFWAGTDPLNANSYLAIKNVSLQVDGHPVVTWQSTQGKSYIVKYSDDMATWNTLTTPVVGDGTILSVVDPTAITGIQKRIYRVFLNY
ncbi:PQQ-dependent sugar dehydrogenase [Pedosphaera parvula]|uniref:PQQ-dependent sugar dehydrogenase n=1 Tax=Pedosphaera parvula TaxID=1032527 RepID=UPI002351F186|nr:PQQ-dependent sugar dehydrogenase [Pedosphaera parvula]